MNAITVQEAQANLPAILSRLRPGEEVVITEDQRPVARLVAERKPVQQRQPGLCKGMITLPVEDDEHLQGFEEYMG